MTNENKYDYHARISKYILATREEEFEILDKEHKPYPYIDMDNGSPDYESDPDYYAGEKWIPIEQISFHRETPQETITQINSLINPFHNGITRLDDSTFITTGTTYKLKSNKEPHLIKFVVSIEHTSFCKLDPTDIIPTIE